MIKKVYKIRLIQKRTKSDILKKWTNIKKKNIWKREICKNEIYRERIYVEKNI